MQEAAVQISQDAIREHNTEMDIARAIKGQFESIYSSTWHCFVGRNIATHVTHQEHMFIYFYIGQTGICLFATA